jgi:hypothetical protein
MSGRVGLRDGGHGRVLVWRTFGPHCSSAKAMHHWQRGPPPRPYFWVFRWHVAQGPTWSPGQVSADGSGSDTGGTGVVMGWFLFMGGEARRLVAGYGAVR